MSKRKYLKKVKALFLRAYKVDKTKAKVGLKFITRGVRGLLEHKGNK